jgi:hypothetical protein
VTDPARWLDGGETLTPDERRALEADIGRSSPSGAKHAVWGALAVKLTVASAAAATTGTAAAATGVGAAASVTTLSLLKFGGAGLALGVFTSTALFVAERPAAPTAPDARDSAVLASAALSASAAAEPVRAAPPPEANTPAPVTADSAGAERSASSQGGRPREASTESATVVESESQRVAHARALLRAGDATQALRSLLALELDEPSGLLTQEREALLIEALAASGKRDAARQRAARFLTRYPKSPHATAVRRAAE